MASFLDFPYDVREKIYRHALVQKRVFIRPFMSMGYLIDADRIEKYGIPNLNLLCTSKQIYAEATPIYLSENIFSIVHIDILAAACAESERVSYNLKMIRKVELVFDTRDYIYMAQFLPEKLTKAASMIANDSQRGDNNSVAKSDAVEGLLRLRDRLDVSGLVQSLPESLGERGSDSGVNQERHQRHVANMKEFLWGRTLTFVRQTFRLSHLYVDLRNAYCLSGCCRLAVDVLGWGWFHAWLYDLPGEIQVRCYSEHEKKIITGTLNRQRLCRGLKTGDVYDQQKVVGRQVLASYNVVLREAYLRLRG